MICKCIITFFSLIFKIVTGLVFAWDFSGQNFFCVALKALPVDVL